MDNEQLKKFRTLNRKDKIELVQILWDDIASEQNDIPFPDDHVDYLNERLEKIKSGKANFKPWDTIQKKYNNS